MNSYKRLCMIPASSKLQSVHGLVPQLSLQVTCGESLGTRLSYVVQLSELPGIIFDAIFVS